MIQLELFTDRPDKADGLYFFRLDFGIISRYSKSFDLKKIPDLKNQALMIQIYFWDPEVIELKEKYGLTGFELCKL